MRILVLGAGAIGGYFGGLLAEAGADITFFVRPARKRQLDRDGLIIESPFENVRRSVAAITSGENFAPPDIIIIACKAYSLEGALDIISAYAGPETIILPLLNGIAHLEIIEQRLPGTAIWGGLAHIGVTLTSDGIIRHLNQLHTLMFGPRDDARHAAADGFLATFAQTSVDAQLRENIVQDLWNKLVFLATLAGSTCLMRANTGTILETLHGKELILGLLDECSAIAAAEGFTPGHDDITLYQQQLTEPGSLSTSSMLRDIERGSPTEAEHIIGDMVSRAMKHELPAPLLGVAYTHLQAYESCRSIRRDLT